VWRRSPKRFLSSWLAWLTCGKYLQSF
jgi:hypothetical protein